MKDNTKKFFIQLGILSLIIGIITIALRILFPEIIPAWIWIIIAYFILCSCLLHLITVKLFSNRQQKKRSLLFLLGNAIRMLTHLTVLTTTILIFRNQALTITVIFFSFYLIFSCFDTIFLQKNQS